MNVVVKDRAVFDHQVGRGEKRQSRENVKGAIHRSWDSGAGGDRTVTARRSAPGRFVRLGHVEGDMNPMRGGANLKGRR
jgi:hypothetical protein